MVRIVGTRVPGSLLRAALMASLVALPQLLLGTVSAGATTLAALAALVLAIFTFAEYVVRAPSIVEFRDARPYNRLRFAALLAAVLLASLLLRPDWDNAALTAVLRRICDVWTHLDVPWSPVHLLLGTLPEDTDPLLGDAIGAAAAVTYALSLLMIAAFALTIRLHHWPGRSAFNVWVNLPQFDPASGLDVVVRLQRDAQVNLSFGLLMPLIAPLAVNILSVPFDGTSLDEPVLLLWMVMAWAFIPASLAMRGLALNRLAWMIAAHRARLRPEGAEHPV
ncbi:hypothetical protein [Rubellimicrobium roseum]|uniref:Uncharacterized protein n=1 Tax=Rubellimicrobium roseum TaxID=687525 RepID=A0A5C4NI45_9RHOB|nr:hypothetical protein [Rubellimicrobium roseum]TNC72357.1 hypothetical protein FHG71_08175 [Rubellimicrobium roseum]